LSKRAIPARSKSFWRVRLVTMAGVEPWNNPWLKGQKAGGLAYLKAGADFTQWKRRPGVALLMYAQIQRDFGWQPFLRVFGEYERMDRSRRPRTDQEKIDRWMTRLSHACARDLRPFFGKWALPLSEEARVDDALDQLPEWMPDFDALAPAGT